MKFYLDTSVVVAASVGGHVHHAAALGTLQSMVKRRAAGYMSAHGLAEAYSVLTRAPFVPPVYPSEAWMILETSILPHVKLVRLPAGEYIEIVRACAEQGHMGGRVHDRIHLQCAMKAGCDRVYTFNVRDFRALAAEEWQEKICAP